MALAWCLKDQKVCSVIIGASRVEQIADNLKAIENTSFSPEELDAITAEGTYPPASMELMVCVPLGAQTTWLMSKANFLWKRPGS